MVIYLDARQRLELTLTEYALVEMIDRLSGPRSPQPGWCVASRRYLAEGLGVTERSVYSLLDRLVDVGLVERRDRLLRPTDSWKRSIEPYRSLDAA